MPKQGLFLECASLCATYTSRYGKCAHRIQIRPKRTLFTSQNGKKATPTPTAPTPLEIGSCIQVPVLNSIENKNYKAVSVGTENQLHWL